MQNKPYAEESCRRTNCSTIKLIRFSSFFSAMKQEESQGRRENVLVFELPERDLHEQLRRRLRERLDLEEVADVLALQLVEEQKRPECAGILHRIPSLMATYLVIKEWDKGQLDQLRKRHPRYLVGEGDGYGIRWLEARRVELQEIARECRYTHQLLRLYGFYREHGQGKILNQNYLAHDPELRKAHGRDGYNLVQNVRKNWRMKMFDIVHLAAEVQPEILRDYRGPNDRKKATNVVPLSI